MANRIFQIGDKVQSVQKQAVFCCSAGQGEKGAGKTCPVKFYLQALLLWHILELFKLNDIETGFNLFGNRPFPVLDAFILIGIN